MTRVAAAVILLCVLTSHAQAKDVCVQIDSYVPGTMLLMKNVKGKGAFGPVHGYLNLPDLNDGSPRLIPVAGQAITSKAGELVVGLTWYEVALNANGTTTVLTQLIPINLACHPGADGKIGVSDTCDTSIASLTRVAQVISCKDVVPIP